MLDEDRRRHGTPVQDIQSDGDDLGPYFSGK